jgi:hypothetical protein
VRQSNKSHYDVLGVEQHATSAQIKKAYRSLSLKLHPDRSSSNKGGVLFQQLNEAYSVLIKPELRASYDLALAGKFSSSSDYDAGRFGGVNWNPVKCTACQKIAAQPRYIVIYTAFSVIFFSAKRPTQGVYCSRCADREIVKGTLITTLLGWWGIPWGPLYSIQSLYYNVGGGRFPPVINAQLLIQQAFYFLSKEDFHISCCLQEQAALFLLEADKALGLDALEHEQALNLRQVKKMMVRLNKQLGVRRKDKALVNPWVRIHKGALLAILSALLPFGLALGFLNNQADIRPPVHHEDSPLTSEQQLNDKPDPKAAKNAPTDEGGLPRPQPPYGKNWPEEAAYVPGFSIFNLDGNASVRVKNTENDYGLFVKLVDIKTLRRVRHVYIPPFSEFLIEYISEGDYDIRFQQLNNGAILKAERFSLQSSEVEWSKYEVTLYGVINGNLQVEEIDESDF